MEVMNKLYTHNLLKARDAFMNSLPAVPPALIDTHMLLYPELTSAAWRPTGPWPALNPHNAAMWVQQQQELRLVAATANNPLFSRINSSQLKDQAPKSPEKVSFSIDNIMTGKYEESRRRSVEEPLSPSSSSEGGLKYECEVCNKTYSTPSGFTKHKQYYCAPQTKKQFNCKYCEKIYYSLGALKMHIRTHTLPCKCKLCGKAFSRPWLLQGHLRTHTGEKPFKCQHCGRAFADRSNLRAHLQTHSEVKKYSCKQCDKTFSRMSLLLKHEETACLAPGGLTRLYM